ncbi:MAG: hypothetical protein DIU69_09490 [Bacillota bacterium]|nr:MAG: hypothetical protein DIU69_09490 [Bacillota bacterium]
MYGILGTAVIGTAYLATYMVVAFILNFIRPAPEGLSWSWARPLAVTLSTIPYAVGGVYATWVWTGRPYWYSTLLGFVTALMERVIILGGGYLTFVSHAGMPKSPDLPGFIQSEAAPYFTPAYLVVGLGISPLVTTVTARLVAVLRREVS